MTDKEEMTDVEAWESVLQKVTMTIRGKFPPVAYGPRPARYFGLCEVEAESLRSRGYDAVGNANYDKRHAAEIAERFNLEVKEFFATHWRDDDTPLFECAPGVRGPDGLEEVDPVKTALRLSLEMVKEERNKLHRAVEDLLVPVEAAGIRCLAVDGPVSDDLLMVCQDPGLRKHFDKAYQALREVAVTTREIIDAEAKNSAEAEADETSSGD